MLAVDTSSRGASYAISSGGRVVASLMGEAFVPHSKTFFANIETLLRLAGAGLGDMDCFVAASGPGSFTGLRVGLSAIMGMAAASSRPAYGLGSIDCVALAAGAAGPTAVLIDAGRDEVYFGVRWIDARGRIVRRFEDRCGAPAGLLASLDFDQLTLAGSGAARYAELIRKAAESGGRKALLSTRACGEQGAWLIRESIGETARALAEYTARAVSLGEPLDPLSACYIRPSDAEIKRGGHA